jgi:Flp pilus assembly protein TadB
MSWTPIDVVVVALALIGALTSMVVTIIAALKGSAAQAQAVAAQAHADANHQALRNLSDRVLGHDQQLNQLAFQLPPPVIGTAQPTTGTSPTASQQGANP